MTTKTVTTTTCDRCGSECINGCVRVAVSTDHWTSQREHLGTDHYQPLELCLDCGRASIGLLHIQMAEMPPYLDEGNSSFEGGAGTWSASENCEVARTTDNRLVYGLPVPVPEQLIGRRVRLRFRPGNDGAPVVEAADEHV